MQLPHRLAATAAGLGLTLAALALGAALASASHPAQTTPGPFRQVVPGLAGDSAEGSPQSTPTTAPTAATTPTPARLTCGSGHDALRAFTDAAAATVARTPQQTTIQALEAVTRPPTLPADGTRSAPLETTFFTIDAHLVSFRLAAGGWWEVVLDNGGGITMRAAFPPGPCLTTLSNDDQGAINGARTAFQLACGQPPATGSKALRGTVTLTGTGYWGTKNIEGAASNGAELAPVFAFKYTDSGSCDPTHFVPTPTPTTPPLLAVAVSVDKDQGTGYHRGETVVATARLEPRIAGVECTPQFAIPLATGGLRVVLEDPGLAPRRSNEEGTIEWRFLIPNDAAPGVSPGGGTLQVACRQGTITRQATIALTIRVP